MSWKPGVFLLAIAVKMHIGAMRKDVVCMSYKCGNATSLMIAGAIAYIKKKIPIGIEVNATDKRVDIYPQRLKQFEKASKYIALSNITFEDNKINIELSMV